MRRWLLGAESRRGSRARGLKRRVEDILGEDTDASDALETTLKAARALPAEGWLRRLRDGQAAGPAERFLALARQQVYARAPGRDAPYSLETGTESPVDGLLEAADALERALALLLRPMRALRARLGARLDEDSDELDTATRAKIEAVCRSLQRRGELALEAWLSMLQALNRDVPPEFVDWLAVERRDGHDVDVGLHRHWIDPTLPFAQAVLAGVQGAVVTSATLRDGTEDPEHDWQVAESRTGAIHLSVPAVRAAVPSPFDYPRLTRVVVVTDVRKDDLKLVAAAYRELFQAAGGGALGLFTAISRLRAVHERVAHALDEAGLTLLAQHVDPIDTSTLIEIFRQETDACLLGTDAVRDGVDVPGRSLRLIVFDRVPWPRPDILHRARRNAFGGRRYDDMMTRLRLKQAFGRLVRRARMIAVYSCCSIR